MDDAFGNLEDISDEQTLERLESLFESSSTFPSLDSSILNEDVGASTNTGNLAGSNLFAPLDSNPEIFVSFNNNNSQGNSQAPGGSPLLPNNNAGSINNDRPGSVSSSSYTGTQPSTPATPAPQPSPVATLPPPSPVKKSTVVVSSSAMPQPTQILYATKSTVPQQPMRSTASLQQQTQQQQPSQQQQTGLILTTPSLMSGPGTVFAGTTQPILQATPGGTLQIQLQPAGGTRLNQISAPNSIGSLRGSIQSAKTQPQLLPKPLTAATAQHQAPKMATVSAANHRQLTGSSSLILNQSGQLLTTTPVSQSAPILINSLGQVVGTAGASANPVLIQQPTGNQVFVLRPSAPTTATAGPATLLPANNQTGGTFLLQQPAGPSTVITAQPQVKIITPQGRMQMQQIQTPSGPKLIAVPVGQTLVQTSAGLISTSSSVLTGFSPAISLPQPTVITSTSTSMGGCNTITSIPSSIHAAPVLSPVKKKKSKKRNKDPDMFNQGAHTGVSAPPKKPKVVDLGELMKDVGLDLEGFNEEPSSNSLHNEDHGSASSASILSSAPVIDTASNSSGSQLVAQIQQPLPLQTTSTNQLQLVQGPDGQFVLQSAAVQQPTILTQTNLEASGLSIPTATPTILGASLGTALSTANLNIAPSAISGPLVGATSLSSVPHQATAAISKQASSIVVTTASSTPSPVVLNNNNIISSKSPSSRPRPAVDSQRVPLFVDDRLPHGWHRKVSQRKSGASAGRYEVFIIGPNGKRFRSKNDLKSFFEKTGESSLDPEDFDFSTFGTGGTGRTPTLTTTTVASSLSTPTAAFMKTQGTGMVTPVVSSTQNTSSSIPQPLNGNNNLISMASVTTKSQPVILSPSDSSGQLVVAGGNGSSGAPNLLQNVHEPLPSKSLDILTSSSDVKPAYSSQISRETADADAQISQLLKTLQEEPHKLSIDTDFIQSLTGTDVDFDGSITPPPPQLTPAVSKTTTTPLSSSLSSTVSPRINAQTMKHHLQHVPDSSLIAPNFQSKFLGSSEQSGTKLKTYTASSANPLPQQILQVSRGEVVSSPNNFSHTPSISVPIGGASTQVRALQNLPSNTRLVRGPNGQYTIQKVQTIELSADMQQSLKEVQSRIQDIEKQSSKTPQDEAELAQLQTKQQRILSLGRPIPTVPSVSTNNVIGSSIGTNNPGASTSTSSIPQPLIASSRVVPSNVQSPFLANILAGNATHKGGFSGGSVTSISTKTQSSVRYAPVTTQQTQSQPLITATKSSSIQGVTTTPSGTNIPPLTEQQKRIVANFKQKMATLPPEQQAQFIAANKASLIKRLNFQPSQIHILCSNRVNQQRNQQLQQQHQQQQQQQQQHQQQQQQQQQLHQQQQQQQLPPPPLPPQTQPAIVSNSVRNPILPIPNKLSEDIKQRSFLSTSGTSIDLTPISKQKKIAWVESQVKKDQNEAVNPNYKTPFRSKEDACKRLLRYHVFDELDPDPEEVIKEEVAFSVKSRQLLTKYRTMRDKYHNLLIQEAMRITTSSEEVMLARLWDSDERQTLTKQKDDYAKKGIILEDLPPIPTSWEEKYISTMGHPPPKRLVKNSIKKPTDLVSRGGKSSSIPRKDYDEFLSIKNELNRYNNVNGVKNTSGSSELFETPPQKIMNERVSDDDDDDFSLKDVCGGNGVDAILGGDDEDEAGEADLVKNRRGSIEDDEDEEDDVAIDFGQNYQHKEVDSVQNAINSILDDRIETPDINNIAGLLDSFSDATSDAATESAVNSIPRF